MRLYSHDHCIIENKKQIEPINYLRLLDPFEGFKEYAAEKDFLNDKEVNKDVPFPVILLHNLDEWKKAHDGKAPGWNDKKEF